MADMEQIVELVKLHPGLAVLVALFVLALGFFLIMRAITKLVWRVVIGAVMGAAAGAGMYFYVCPALGLPPSWAGIAALVFFAFGLIFKKVPGL